MSEMQPDAVHFAFTPTSALLARAIRAYAVRSRTLLLVGSLTLFPLGVVIFSGQRPGSEWIRLLPAAAVIAVLAFSITLGPDLQAQRAFRHRPSLSNPINGWVAMQGYHTRAEHADLNLEWAEFERLIVTGDLILLKYRGQNQVQYIPREAFDSEADWLRFQQIAREGIEATRSGMKGAGS